MRPFSQKGVTKFHGAHYLVQLPHASVLPSDFQKLDHMRFYVNHLMSITLSPYQVESLFEAKFNWFVVGSQKRPPATKDNNPAAHQFFFSEKLDALSRAVTFGSWGLLVEYHRWHRWWPDLIWFKCNQSRAFYQKYWILYIDYKFAFIICLVFYKVFFLVEYMIRDY